MSDKKPRRQNNIDPEVAAARARVAGLASAAARTPEENSAMMHDRANARWAKHRAERGAQAVEPPKPSLDERFASAQLALAEAKKRAASRLRP